MTRAATFLRRSGAALVCMLLQGTVGHAQAGGGERQDWSRMFDLSSIHGGAGMDLGGLIDGSGGAMPAGTYPLDVVVNDNHMGRRQIRLGKLAGKLQPVPCITVEMLRGYGLRPEHLETLAQALAAAPGGSAQTQAGHPGQPDHGPERRLGSLLMSTRIAMPPTPASGPVTVQPAKAAGVAEAAGCADLALLDERAHVEFDAGRLQLRLTLPQALLVEDRRGYVDESLWDAGVNAAFTSYQFNLRADQLHGRRQQSAHLGLNNGLNLGGWRLRNDASLSHTDAAGTRFSSNRTFLQHDVTALKGQFSVGEIYSGPDIFNSVRLQGMQLMSDEGMLADSERGYAPVVRGVAETHATVEVRQNGYLLHSTTVPPGPFALSQIHPSGSNGDLRVTIIESDGRRRHYTQAFSILPLMVRGGRLRYSAEMGQYQSNFSGLESPALASLSGIYGLTDSLSIAGGAQLSRSFQAFNIGIGGNTPLGAVSVDATQSRSLSQQGHSVRALYSRAFAATRTEFTLAAYRYSTAGYRSLDQHVAQLSAGPGPAYLPGLQASRPRMRMDLSINQTLGQDGQYGGFFLNATRESYWDARQSASSISASYGNSWRGISYSLSYARTQTRGLLGGARDNHALTLSLSIPLGSGGQSSSAYASLRQDQDQGLQTIAGLSGDIPGIAGATYSLQGVRDPQGGQSGSMGASLRTPHARLGANVGAGPRQHHYGVSASGAAIAHGGGLNFAHSLGDSFALVRVDGAQGVAVTGPQVGSTAGNHYLVYPFAQPYRANTIRLDAASVGADVELDALAQTVVPRRGAVVQTVFKATSGRRAQIRFVRAAGQPPVGAMVRSEEGRNLGMLDHNGQALLLLDGDQGRLSLSWEDGAGGCQARYALPPRDPALYYYSLTIPCE